MKKHYIKPTMWVYQLPNRQQLLSGSTPDNWTGIPGMDSDDMNKLA